MKKLVSYTPISFLVFLVLGIILQFYQSIWKFGFHMLFLIIVVTIIILFILKLKSLKVWFSIVAAFVFILIGIAAVFIQNPKNYSNYYFKNHQPNETVLITIHQILKPGNYYTKYIAKVTQVNNTKTIGKVLVNIKKDSLDSPLKVNQQFILKPEFKELIPPLNPHQFNYKEYLAKQHIYHQLFLNNSELKQVDDASFSLIGLSASVRNNIQQSLQKHNFSKDEYSVINALLLGQRQEISKELLDDYTNAGAIHILAISGFSNSNSLIIAFFIMALETGGSNLQSLT